MITNYTQLFIYLPLYSHSLEIIPQAILSTLNFYPCVETCHHKINIPQHLVSILAFVPPKQCVKVEATRSRSWSGQVTFSRKLLGGGLQVLWHGDNEMLSDYWALIYFNICDWCMHVCYLTSQPQELTFVCALFRCKVSYYTDQYCNCKHSRCLWLTVSVFTHLYGILSNSDLLFE